MPHFELEGGYIGKVVAGVDEVGRGPLVGPVFAAAVIVDRSYIIDGIDDSKKLSAKRREIVYHDITKHYVYGIGSASVEEINTINILEATKLAYERAIANLSITPDIVLVDGNTKFSDKRYISIIKGDLLSYSIAAASIVAKVARDGLMDALARDYPDYAWHKNKGYGTQEHIAAIRTHGTTEHHRNFVVKGLSS